MGSPRCDDDNLKKGPWTPEEDQKLVDYINKHGYGSWRALPKLAGLNRCGKSCRLRWTNYLRPDIKRGRFSEDEERLIINLHSVIGNKWSRIASHLPGRTDNEIKNFWNTHIRKKLLSMGIDPTTHKPRTDINHLLNLSQMLYTSPLGNLMNPWENNAHRLQTDATQLAKIQLIQNLLQLINTTTLPNINQSILLGPQNPNPLEGLVNGSISSIYTKEPDLLPNASLINSGLNILQATNHQQALTNSWSSFESGLLDLEGLDILNNNSLSNPYPIQPESTLPQLVSASPETTTTNQMERNDNTTQLSNTSSPVSNDFEAWEKVLLEDDETRGSYWKNILDFTSSPPSLSW